MSDPGSVRRLERWMVNIRWGGVVLGVAVLILQPGPDGRFDPIALGLIALLAVGNAAIMLWLSRLDEEAPTQRTDLMRLSVAAFAFDATIVMAAVWNAADQQPYTAWAILFFIPLEGALRFRLRGALMGAAALAAFLVPQSARVAHITDTAFDLANYIFISGLGTLFGAVAGTMAENWHVQREAFQQQSLKLAEVDRLKDRFLAVTSHEIRGPLTAVITGVTTVKRRLDRLSREQQEKLLDMVSVQAQQLARLVDDLTLTSQLQSGQLALQPEWCDLEETVQNALEAAAVKRQAHQLHVFVEPLQCEFDAARIGQIVRNLVENAYKYTPEDTKVAVTARAVDHGILIKVEDNGPGIPSDKRDQLFEAFSRIEETAAGQEGVGLGLYVVSQLASAMNGRIDLASSSRGTTFGIHVPCNHRPAGERHLGLVKASGVAPDPRF